MKHDFHPTILREYDIRGIVGDTLTEADARAVGHAFGTMLARQGKHSVASGRDGRLSSPSLQAALVEGLMAAGCAVTDIGMGPTPMCYFAIKHLKLDAGVQITGSHNPPEYNGIKMATHGGPVYGDAIQEIGRLARAGDLESGAGSVAPYDIRQAYIQRILDDYSGPRDLTVVWDCGNGATGEVMRELVKRLPGTHHLLFDEVDGTFPNHHPDPTVPEYLVDLQKMVASTGADMGIGFDGDGDRIGAIDEKGRIVGGDQLVALYAIEVLKTHPGAVVLGDVKCSQTMFDKIAALGGKPQMYKTGHSLLKARMAEIGAPLAGEMSGHIFFADKFYGYDDAIYCGVRLMDLVSKSGGTLGDLRDGFPPVYNTPETRFQVDEARKFKTVEEIRQRLTPAPDGWDVNKLDGVRVTTDKGWWLIRASNTQDVLVARAEAGSESDLAEMKALLLDQLRASGVEAPSGF